MRSGAFAASGALDDSVRAVVVGDLSDFLLQISAITVDGDIAEILFFGIIKAFLVDIQRDDPSCAEDFATALRTYLPDLHR